MPIPVDLKAIIFDMDGIIVDSEPIHVKAFKIFLDRLNVSYTDEFIDSLVGYSIDHNIQTINAHYFPNNLFCIALRNEYFSINRLERADLIVDSLNDIVSALERQT